MKILEKGALAVVFGMALGAILPTPVDAIHFFVILPWLQQNMYTASKITVMFVSILDWYVLQFLWFFSLAMAAFMWKIDKKLQMIGAIIGFGSVVGLFSRFYYEGIWIIKLPDLLILSAIVGLAIFILWGIKFKKFKKKAGNFYIG